MKLFGALLIASAVVAVALIYAMGARLYLGAPVVDCGGLPLSHCRLAMDSPTHGTGEGPITYFKLEPFRPGSTCGDWSVERVEFGFGPVGWGSPTASEGEPFC
jgi:hypothetical protein